MPRPPRLEFPDALYQVTARGNAGLHSTYAERFKPGTKASIRRLNSGVAWQGNEATRQVATSNRCEVVIPKPPWNR